MFIKGTFWDRHPTSRTEAYSATLNVGVNVTNTTETILKDAYRTQKIYEYH